ncbi:MAG: hypothetical protein R3B90_15535 [Planctomycetaceae bacterium]|jgi:hypothetical protein
MPQSRDNLERQLSLATKAREACANHLKEMGVDEKGLKKQPAWKSANATCRQLSRRLQRVAKKEQLTVEVAARKAAAESGDAEE